MHRTEFAAISASRLPKPQVIPSQAPTQLLVPCRHRLLPGACSFGSTSTRSTSARRRGRAGCQRSDDDRRPAVVGAQHRWRPHRGARVERVVGVEILDRHAVGPVAERQHEAAVEVEQAAALRESGTTLPCCGRWAAGRSTTGRWRRPRDRRCRASTGAGGGWRLPCARRRGARARRSNGAATGRGSAR